MDTALKELIDMFKNIAPQLWEVSMKQVYMSARLDLIWGVITLLICLILAGFLIWGFVIVKKSDSYDKSNEYLALGLMSFMLALVFILPTSLLTNAYMYFNNPEWYAIKMLLGSVGK